MKNLFDTWACAWTDAAAAIPSKEIKLDQDVDDRQMHKEGNHILTGRIFMNNF